MSGYQSDDEVRASYIREIGSEVGPFYHRLRNHAIHLHFRWHEYVELYGKDQIEFDIMNATAPHFFAAVQDIWWQSILLGISRFADSDRVAGRATLSLRSFMKFPIIGSIEGMGALADDALSKAKFAKDWRNRIIAHTDLHHDLDRAASPLAHASRVNVRESLAAIASVIDAVEFRFMKATTYWGDSQSGDGGHLLRQLKIYRRIERERKERIRTGQATADDQDWDKWHGKF
jgi:hypothetical protein